MFNLFVQYVRAKSDSSRELVKNLLHDKYINDKDAFDGHKMLQEVLTQKGFYRGKIDGFFGRESIVAFHKFLKEKGYYNNSISGVFNSGTIAAIKSYQKSINVKVTGKINLETANKIRELEVN